MLHYRAILFIVESEPHPVSASRDIPANGTRDTLVSAQEERTPSHAVQSERAMGRCAVPRVRRSQQTFAQFVQRHYLPHAKVRKRSWRMEVGVLRWHILPAFGSSSLGRITKRDIGHWQEGMLAKGLAPTTCNRALSLLKCIFNCAVRWEMLKNSPCKDVPALPEGEQRERYLSREEADRLLAVLAEDKDRQAAQVIRLLLFTGARKSEILKARWENVDMERRILTVPLSKSGKSRHVPLSDAAMAVLREIPRTSGWLFPSARRDNAISSVFRVWDRVRRRAGLEDVRLHDLRHSFASFLVNSGCTLYEVQKILGHHNPKVTMRYAHLAQESLLRAVNMVGANLGRKS